MTWRRLRQDVLEEFASFEGPELEESLSARAARRRAWKSTPAGKAARKRWLKRPAGKAHSRRRVARRRKARKARGLCERCGEKAVNRTHCALHRDLHNAAARRRRSGEAAGSSPS